MTDDKSVQNAAPTMNDAARQMKRANLRLALIIAAVVLAIYVFMIVRVAL